MTFRAMALCAALIPAASPAGPNEAAVARECVANLRELHAAIDALETLATLQEITLARMPGSDDVQAARDARPELTRQLLVYLTMQTWACDEAIELATQ